MIKVMIDENQVNVLSEGDFVAHLDTENLIDVYDNTNAPQELSYRASHPENDFDVPLDDRVKAEIVRTALTDIFEDRIIDLVNDYIKTHQDRLYELQKEFEEQDRLESY